MNILITGVSGFSRLLENLPGLTLPNEAPWARHIYWLYTVQLDENKLRIQRDELMRKLIENKTDARPAFIPMHQQPIYKNGGKYLVAERLSRQGLSLPSYVNIREEDQMRVCETIRTIILAQ